MNAKTAVRLSNYNDKPVPLVIMNSCALRCNQDGIPSGEQAVWIGS